MGASIVHVVPGALPTWHTSRYVVVEFPAHVDLGNAEHVRDQLYGVLDAGGSGGPPVIADLTGTTFCDSTAVNALLRARERALRLDRRLYAAVSPAGLVRRVFDITGLGRLIPMCDDLGSAVALAVVSALDEKDGRAAKDGGPRE
jgi:anti-sigma B factor antagonist